MKKIITACFIVLCLSITMPLLASETDVTIYDASKQIAKRLYPYGWITTRVFKPIEKTKVIEIKAVINDEIVKEEKICYFRYFRYHTKSRTMKYYKKGVAVFSFCGGKWRLTNTWLLNQVLLDKDPELYWEIYDLEPF